ncbi:MAG: hypothetical protein O9327_02305 [Polaromonas sp.]|nr:hypothetical protein [Polaromonas sp.]
MDVVTHAPLQPLAELISKGFNTTASKTIQVKSIARTGHLWYDGGALCGSYVELADANAVEGTVAVQNLTANQVADRLHVTAMLDLNAKARLHWHFAGVRQRPRIGGLEVGNYCPGGGFGGYVGVTASKRIPLSWLIEFAQSTDGTRLVARTGAFSPSSFPMTLEIGAGRLGTIGVPITVPVPPPRLQAEIQLAVVKRFVIELPGGMKREFALDLQPDHAGLINGTFDAAWRGSLLAK